MSIEKQLFALSEIKRFKKEYMDISLTCYEINGKDCIDIVELNDVIKNEIFMDASIEIIIDVKDDVFKFVLKEDFYKYLFKSYPLYKTVHKNRIREIRFVQVKGRTVFDFLDDLNIEYF